MKEWHTTVYWIAGVGLWVPVPWHAPMVSRCTDGFTIVTTSGLLRGFVRWTRTCHDHNTLDHLHSQFHSLCPMEKGHESTSEIYLSQKEERHYFRDIREWNFYSFHTSNIKLLDCIFQNLFLDAFLWLVFLVATNSFTPWWIILSRLAFSSALSRHLRRSARPHATMELVSSMYKWNSQPDNLVRENIMSFF